MICLVRHFEDLDDLRYSLNPPLKEVSSSEASKAVTMILKSLRGTAKSNLLIISSGKQRCLETARLIKTGFENTCSYNQIDLEVSNSLRDLNQGKLRLPEDYSPGSRFKPLDFAWKTFAEESFIRKQPYKFGSHFSCDKKREFDELKFNFLIPGETAMGLFNLYCDFLKSLSSDERIFSDYDLILVSHSSFISIFTELKILFDEVISSGIDVDEHPMYKCWEIYNKYKSEIEPKTFFDVRVIDENILKAELFQMLLNS